MIPGLSDLWVVSQLDDLPGSFMFESRLVFCANVIPRRNDAFKAVLSRCDIFEFERQPGRSR